MLQIFLVHPQYCAYGLQISPSLLRHYNAKTPFRHLQRQSIWQVVFSLLETHKTT